MTGCFVGADEVGRVIFVARPVVSRHLRVRTKRAPHFDALAGIKIIDVFRGNYFLRGHPGFHPALHRAQHVVLGIALRAA